MAKAQNKGARRPIPVLGGALAVVLDYGKVRPASDILNNLSGVSYDGTYLWTVSDEGRTVERLTPNSGGFAFAGQLKLDRLFRGLPGRTEVDLEGIDAVGNRIWLCGSHSRTRLKGKHKEPLPGVRRRASRHLLGSFDASEVSSSKGYALPFREEGSLRRRLRSDPLVAEFMDLPSKENGLDIEGLVVADARLLLGLRGPIVAGYALVIELTLRKNGEVGAKKPYRHLLDLGGLGIRDIIGDGDTFLILAGPVTGADGPFLIYRWNGVRSSFPHHPTAVRAFPQGDEHPEGMCLLSQDGRPGLLVLYDSPNPHRISGHAYRADWFDMSGW